MASVTSFLQGLLFAKNFNKKLISRAVHNLSTTLPTDDDVYQIKRSKTKLQFIFISLIVFGIEICYAVETAFVSPILQRIGVPIGIISIIWGLSPLIGFFICPIMGVLSDSCDSKLGRRRPFIIIYSFGILCGLILLGYGSSLGGVFWKVASDQVNPCVIMLTIIGVVLLDFNCDACQSPARAYLIDISCSEDHAIGLSTFTLMAGAGGALGYALGGIPWDKAYPPSMNATTAQMAFNTTTTEFLSNSEETENIHQKVLFTFVAIIYALCTIVCISSFKEIQMSLKHIVLRNASSFSQISTPSSYSLNAPTPMLGSAAATGLAIDEADASHSKMLIMKRHLYSLIYMPAYLKWLCLTHCLCWMSLLCFSLYFTDFVGQEIYGGDPISIHDFAKHNVYIEGVRIGSVCMALYSISCSINSFFLRNLIDRFGIRRVYIFSQLIYAVGMCVLAMTKSLVIAPFTAITAGIMYSTLFTIPFILLAGYHSDEENDMLVDGMANRGLGTDLSMVSSMVFVAQIILSGCISLLMKFFEQKVVVVYAASIFSTCAAISSNKLLFY